MYKNIGTKIKALAKIIGIGGAVLCAVAAFILILLGGAYESKTLYIFAAVSFVSCFLCIISSWPLYGFGELIEKTAAIEKNTRTGKSVSPDLSDEVYKKLADLKQLKLSGVITEEEYRLKERQLLD